MTSTAIIVGGGPSAAALDLLQLKTVDAAVFVINDCFKRLPWAPVLFTADGMYFNRRLRDLLLRYSGNIVAALPNERRVVLSEKYRRRVRYIRRIPGCGFHPKPDGAYFADNSGFACLGYAAASGFKRIALVGFDLGEPGHWHGGYEWGPGRNDNYAKWARDFDFIAPDLASHGCDVVNVNPESNIRAYRFVSFDDVISGAAWA